MALTTPATRTKEMIDTVYSPTFHLFGCAVQHFAQQQAAPKR